jgi:hypothetical protein
MADHAACGFQNRLGRPVVLIQRDDPGSREISLEVQNIRDVSTPPSVDGLVVVSHHADVPVFLNKQPDQFILYGVGILEFVDHHVLEQTLVDLQYLGKPAQKDNRQSEEISKIESVIPSERFLILCIDLGYLSLKDIETLGNVILLGNTAIFGPIDLSANQVWMKDPGIDLEILHDVPDEALLVLIVVNDKTVLIPEMMDVLPQDTNAGRMKGADPDPLASLTEKTADPFLHFIGSLIGERDGQDAEWRNLLLLDEIGHPMREDTGLAASCARKNQKRSFGVKNRLLLYWI